MGGPCSLRLYATDKADFERLARLLESEASRLETKYSRYREDSFLSQINRAAMAGRSIRVDEETAGLLTFADTVWQASEGLFDITSGKLRELWPFSKWMKGEAVVLPAPDAINALLDQIGWHRLEWYPTTKCLHFSQPGLELDLGGLVKEFTADRLASYALELGVVSGIVEMGGDIALIGPHPDGRPWDIGIWHPRQPGHVLASVALAVGALASSGDYQRRVIVDGQRYSHILNPKTGYPVSGLLSVSIQAEKCIMAGALATTAMIMGKAGIKWLDEMGVSYLAIDEEQKISGSIIS